CLTAIFPAPYKRSSFASMRLSLWSTSSFVSICFASTLSRRFSCASTRERRTPKVTEVRARVTSTLQRKLGFLRSALMGSAFLFGVVTALLFAKVVQNNLNDFRVKRRCIVHCDVVEGREQNFTAKLGEVTVHLETPSLRFVVL